jgi:mono/diheme cytochrome c family protein
MRFAILFLLVFTSLAVVADDGAGAAVYRKSCSVCHAADGSGNTPAGKSMKVRDLRTPEVQEQSDEALAAIVADGKAKMPGFKSSLSAEQIRDVVAFLRTLRK